MGLGRATFVTFAIGAAVAGLFTWINRMTGFANNISNFLFLLGLVYILIGSCLYINNIGLFKSLSYMIYKRRFLRTGNADPQARPLTLVEYALERDKRRSSFKEYFLVGLPLLVVSYAVAFIVH